LLLSPTGQIRAEFTVAALPEATLLLQDPAQPASIGDLLARYVLSSDVRLEDRTDALTLVAVPGATNASLVAAGDAAAVGAASLSSPSCVGRGVDILGPVAGHDVLIDAMSADFTRVDAAALEAWRVAAGLPRFGVDALEDDLPQEGGFGDAVESDGRRVGAITSATATEGRWSVLAKVRWDARDASLTARSSQGSSILAARRADDGGSRG
jgi:folate-binding Fe-S cluster repair protein YgfZ